MFTNANWTTVLNKFRTSSFKLFYICGKFYNLRYIVNPEGVKSNTYTKSKNSFGTNHSNLENLVISTSIKNDLENNGKSNNYFYSKLFYLQ